MWVCMQLDVPLVSYTGALGSLLISLHAIQLLLDADLVVNS